MEPPRLGAPAPGAHRQARRLCPTVLGALALAGMLVGPAQAANLFTLDPQADSFGPIVTDAAGNGYVAWLHTGTPNDSTMFCKLAPGARRCANPITLPAPAGDPTLNTPSQPFAVLGGAGTPAGTVYVVENRYVANDTVIWKSTDAGQTFSGPDDIGQGCYSNNTNIDDVLWWNGAVGFVTGSHNPGLGYGFSVYGETCAGPLATPGTGPGQGATGWQFGNPGSGGVGSATLGFASSSNPKSDQIEAYWLLSTPPTVDFFRYSERTTEITPKEDLSSTLPSNWAGPIRLTDGYLPRLAGGAAGLFLLSADATSQGADPSAVDVRKYDPTQHTFGQPVNLQTFQQSEVGLFDGGALGENADTGELVAAWPHSSTTGGSLMRLYLSTNGGASFSPGEEVAAIGGGYAIEDNARLAVADNGAGFLTFKDSGGLEVSDLNPTSLQFSVLSSNGNAVTVPVICPAPHGHCAVRVSITQGTHKASLAVAARRASGGTIASGSFMITAGATKKLKVPLTAAGRRALHAHHGRLKATLSLTLHATAWSHTTTAAVTVRG
jgi:hypothetical protein